MRPTVSRATLAALLAVAPLVAHAQLPAPALKAGDSWSYRSTNDYNHLPLASWTREVSAANGEIRIVTTSADGKTQVAQDFQRPGLLADGPLNDRASGALQPALELLPFPLEPGKKWTQHVIRKDPVTGETRHVLVEGKVVGWEQVRVPAGEFRALRVERRMWLGDWDQFRGQTWRAETEWYAPEVKGAVKLHVFEEYSEYRYAAFPLMPGDRLVYELTSYKAS